MFSLLARVLLHKFSLNTGIVFSNKDFPDILAKRNLRFLIVLQSFKIYKF